MQWQFCSLGDWVDWKPGDRHPHWTGQWRLMNPDGTVAHEGSFNSCYWYVEEHSGVSK